MKVYFTASVTADGQYRRQYVAIVARLTSLGHSLTSGRQIIDTKLQEKDKDLTAQEIFEREKKAIDAADCVVAEVTKPSSGVGGEIVYALIQNKPVLALFYKDAPNLLSPMIAGNPSEHLYLEHYDEENLPVVLKHFFAQVKVLNGRQGKLIVIDGGDGSGKTVQSEMLVSYLKKKGIPVKCMDFPRYYTSFHGRVVGRFLKGEFGKLNDVSPYLASLAYALDRAGAKEEMDEWLARGGIVVSNRYATSNMAHQGARLPEEKRKEFLEWIDELEYKVHKIPREDIVIYLYVPWQIGLALTQKKGGRSYVGGKEADIAERDLNHRQEAEKMYFWLAKTCHNWVKIDCTKDGQIISKEEIHQRILSALRQKRILSR